MPANAEIATGLARIGVALRAQAWLQTEATGLPPTQAQILAQLVQRGRIAAGRVASEIAAAQPTANDAVTALVRKGYVERRPDPNDARALRLHPTKAGQRLAGAAAIWPDALLAAIEALDPNENAAFLKGLTKTLRALQRRGAITAQRMCVSCQYLQPHAHPDAAQPHHCVFVDVAFGDAALRLDCGDHVEAEVSIQLEGWARFTQAAA